MPTVGVICMVSVAKERETNSVGQLIAFGGVSFLILFNAVALWSTRALILSGANDFRPYYGTALMIRRGDRARIYQDDAQHEIQRELLPLVEPSQLPFNHPAYEALLFIPLTYLPYNLASIVWTILNLGLLVVIGRLLFRQYKNYSVVLILLSFAPITFTLILGQDSILLLLIFVLALRLESSGRQAKAGVLLGLGLFRFHLLVPFLFIIVLRRQWRLVGAFLAMAILLLIVSAVIGSPSEYLSLIISQSLHSDDPRFVHVHLISNMPTIHGLLFFLFRSLVPNSIIGIAGIICSIFLLSWIGLRRTSSVLGVPPTLLASHYLYAYDLTLLVLPICEYLVKAPSKRRMIPIVLITALPVYLVLGLFSAVSLMALPVIALVFQPVRQPQGLPLVDHN